MTDTIQVFTTVDSREAAGKVARAVIEQRVGACVQVVGPIESSYWWDGAIDTAQEWLCIIKSTRDAYPALESTILKHHPYDVPEILAVPVTAGHTAYLDWLRGELQHQ